MAEKSMNAQGQGQPKSTKKITVGNSGDFVIHNLKSVQQNELRFPNRYIVDDWADGDQSLV